MLLTISAKCPIIDVSQDPKYISGSQNITYEYQFQKYLLYNTACNSVAGKAHKPMTTFSETLSKGYENCNNQALNPLTTNVPLIQKSVN